MASRFARDLAQRTSFGGMGKVAMRFFRKKRA
jgi:hypothetical protein